MKTKIKSKLILAIDYVLILVVDVEFFECWGSIGCALAPTLCGGTRVHEISKT